MDSRLHKLKQSLESAVEGMSGEQLSWHLPGKWCAAELLEHLYLTYTGTIKGFERVMTSGKPLGSRASMNQRLRTFVVVGLGHMPGGVKAPAVAVPKGLPIAQCEARFGSRAHVLDHPILGPLTAPQWRKLHAVHGRHHHKQILQLRASATRQTS